MAEPTIEPTFESSRATNVAKTESTRKSVPFLESRIWLCQLAKVNLTAMIYLIDGYTDNDVMCTTCIEAKKNETLIRVPVKCTTKPFKLVHSYVCSLNPELTFRDNR